MMVAPATPEAAQQDQSFLWLGWQKTCFRFALPVVALACLLGTSPLDAADIQLKLPAGESWYSTGLYLAKGDAIAVKAADQWSIGDNNVYKTTADGIAGSELDGCRLGSLVGRIGMASINRQICLGADFNFTAAETGIFYLQVNDGFLEDNSGRLTIDINAQPLRTMMQLTASALSITPLNNYQLPEIEIVSRHLMLTLPTHYLKQHQQHAIESLDLLDRIYTLESQLNGGHTPFSTQRMAIVVDDSISSPGMDVFMSSGYPIRMKSLVLGSEFESEPMHKVGMDLLGLHDLYWSHYVLGGLAHEMGHNFSFVNLGALAWGAGGGILEAWANIYALYALEQINHPEKDRMIAEYNCESLRKAHFKGGRYQDILEYNFVATCFLLEFQQLYGWRFYQDFFHAYHQQYPDFQQASVLIGSLGSDALKWRWLEKQFSVVAGKSTADIFKKYHIEY